MGERTLTLTMWALATFNTSLFVVAGVVTAHAGGVLGDLLSGLNTVIGVVVFLYLWFLFVIAVRWVLSNASLLRSPVRALVLRSVAAGGVAGIVFLLSVLLVGIAPSVLSGSLRPVSVILIILIGVALAAVVGSIVGLLTGLLNVLAYRIAGGTLPANTRS